MSAEESDPGSLEEFFAQYGQPGDPEYHNNMGLAHRMEDDLDGAIREYREAICLKPGDVRFHCNLASVWAQKGEYEEALRGYEQALRLDPNDAVTHFNLGNLLRKTERDEEAMAEYQRAIELEPERTDACYALANCYWDREQWQEAATCYAQALAATPDAPVAGLAHLRLGLHYTDERVWDEAETHLLEAHDEDPFMANYGLAIVYLNRPVGAEPAWVFPAKAIIHARKAVELQPEDEDALHVARAARAAYERTKPPLAEYSRRRSGSRSR